MTHTNKKITQKQIKQVVRKLELKEKALVLIDTLVSLEAHSGLMEKLEDPFLSQLYRISHAASNTECSHPEWEKEIEDLYIKFKKENLI